MIKVAVYKLPSVGVLSSESVVVISSVTAVVAVVSTTRTRGGRKLRGLHLHEGVGSYDEYLHENTQCLASHRDSYCTHYLGMR